MEVPVVAGTPKLDGKSSQTAAKQISKPAKPDHRVTSDEQSRECSPLALESVQDQHHNGNS
jgi:hypothetical protein